MTADAGNLIASQARERVVQARELGPSILATFENAARMLKEMGGVHLDVKVGFVAELGDDEIDGLIPELIFRVRDPS